MRCEQRIDVGKNNINTVCDLDVLSQWHAAQLLMEHCWLQKLMFLADMRFIGRIGHASEESIRCV